MRLEGTEKGRKGREGTYTGRERIERDLIGISGDLRTLAGTGGIERYQTRAGNWD